MVEWNPYHIICKGIACETYRKCKGKKCSQKRKLRGCNYSKESDCEYCSYKDKCVLLKPSSDELYELEHDRLEAEWEIHELTIYINEWRKIESNLKKNNMEQSVLDYRFYDRPLHQMVERRHDLKKLVKLCLEEESKLIKKINH